MTIKEIATPRRARKDGKHTLRPVGLAKTENVCRGSPTDFPGSILLLENHASGLVHGLPCCRNSGRDFSDDAPAALA